MSLEAHRSEGLCFLSERLVRHIESHADSLADGLCRRVEKSPRLQRFCQLVPRNELRQRAYEIYRNLGEWLQLRSEVEMEKRYQLIGERRATQRVPLSELILAILVTKEHLWEQCTSELLTEHAHQLMQVLELSRAMDAFFDRAIYFAARGYEHGDLEAPDQVNRRSHAA